MQALLKSMFPRQQDLSTRAHNAMPRQPRALRVQCPRYLARRARIARRIRNVAIGCNFAAWHAPHLSQHVGEHAVFRRLGRVRTLHFFTPLSFFAEPMRTIGFFGERRATSLNPARSKVGITPVQTNAGGSLSFNSCG